MATAWSSKTDPILRWLEDETFFSICSRQHLILGHLDVSSTLAWLYGENHRAIIHDFPGNLNALDHKLTACWGCSHTIIHEHTILPVFCPFQAPQRVEAAENLMRGSSVGSLKYLLGLVTGKFGAEHPLKACNRCMHEDRVAHGTAYWHRAHQFPGVLLCQHHDSELTECTINRQWSGRFKWVLPDEKYLESKQPAQTSSFMLSSMRDMILALAEVGSSFSFNSHLVSALYKERVSFLQSSNADGWNAASCFVTHISELQQYPPFTCLPKNRKEAEVFIAQMVRKPRGHCHPLKHLTFIHWLFSGFSKFYEDYLRFSALRGLAYEEVSAQATDPERLALAPAYNSYHLVIRKPKKIKPKTRKMIIRHLHSGISKKNLCSMFAITVCTLNRIMRSEQGLLATWKGKQFAQSLLRHRSEWTDVLAKNSELSPNKIRQIIPNNYAWLYRNDRSWLNTQIRTMRSGRIGNNSTVDWNQRDSTLYALVSSILFKEYGTLDNLTVLPQDLHRLIPSLSRALAKRTRYPQTRSLLAKITTRCLGNQTTRPSDGHER
ncbi:TnsD family Tn7-like transposition protein [Pseudomonas sp. ICMP 561]|uniref:TnsD family Tn7-like transposition protein n=1 Tax=Pseudomonas sp. ICMP 561 TaxID=1718918 RepID=UPI000C089493|nr:TnsD family Tn7-like transposition protein [Pseudomonas sp. ICMP 561]PHN22821.1 hypothetical protein AO242_16225 [Pseudomonas sp. ICMP 561]